MNIYEQTGSIGKSYVYTMAALRFMPKDANEDPVGCPPGPLLKPPGGEGGSKENSLGIKKCNAH